jgi:hypothetical protein
MEKFVATLSSPRVKPDERGFTDPEESWMMRKSALLSWCLVLSLGALIGCGDPASTSAPDETGPGLDASDTPPTPDAQDATDATDAPDAPDAPDEDGGGDTGPDVPTGVLDPVASTVVVSPETLPADGISAAVVSVTLLDTAGEPLPGLSVSLQVDGGDSPIVVQPSEPTDSAGVTLGRIFAIEGQVFTVRAAALLDPDVELISTGAVEFSGCATTADYYRALYGPVFSVCAGCHTDYGFVREFNESNATSVWTIPFGVDDDAVGEALATFGGLVEPMTPLLLLKPSGQLGHYGGEVVPAGSPAFAHLEAFVSRLQSGFSCNAAPEDFFAGVEFLSDGDTFYKASIALLGRPPTADELATFAADPDLDVAVDLMMENDDFYVRLQEIFNDLFLTDRRLGSFKLINHLSKGDYPDRYYFRRYQANVPQYNNRNNTCGNPRDPKATCCHDNAEDSVRQCTVEGLQVPFCEWGDANAVLNLRREAPALIAYVVRNDLPFSEVLTADYTVVNPMTARLYRHSGFNEPSFDDPCDVTDWKPIRLRIDNFQGVDRSNVSPSNEVPHAGILSTHTFLNRYMTTTTNLNRHRASTVYKKLLDIDIERLTGVVVDQSEDLSGNPTLTGRSCSVCHAAMDPVAGAFSKWTSNGQVRRGRVNFVCDPGAEDCDTGLDCIGQEVCSNGACVPPSMAGYDPALCVREIGFHGDWLPPGNVERAPLRWLGARLAEDERFYRATVKTLLRVIASKESLHAPDDPLDLDYAAQARAFRAQEAEIERVTALFLHPANGQNLKAAVKGIVLGPHFRAGGGAVPEDRARDAVLGQLGRGRLLTPEQLARKIRAVLGAPWVTTNGRGDSLLDVRDGYRIVYGGIDSGTIVVRNQDPSPLTANVVRRMSNEMACLVVPQQFSWDDPAQRTLLSEVDPALAPEDDGGDPANEDEIYAAIQRLHSVLLNEDLPREDPAIVETYGLLVDVWRTGNVLMDGGEEPRTLRGYCQATRDLQTDQSLTQVPGRSQVRDDDNYMIRAWMAVVSYLLSDAEFLLE